MSDKYKVLRFNLGLKWNDGVCKNGAEDLEKQLNELAEKGYEAKFHVEEYEGLASRKAIILEKKD